MGPGPVPALRRRAGKAFAELVARIGAVAPQSVLDLGCGPGDLTVDLARRWPGAALHGVDSSAETPLAVHLGD